MSPMTGTNAMNSQHLANRKRGSGRGVDEHSGEDVQHIKAHPKRKQHMWKASSRLWALRLTVLRIAASRSDNPGGISLYVSYHVEPAVVALFPDGGEEIIASRWVDSRRRGRGEQYRVIIGRENQYMSDVCAGIVRVIEASLPTYSKSIFFPLFLSMPFIFHLCWFIALHMFCNTAVRARVCGQSSSVSFRVRHGQFLR
jgi:hypothetical protein